MQDLQALVAANEDVAAAIAAAYEILLGGVPNVAGFEFLIGNALATNFGSNNPGIVFNQENIFINIANSLVQGNPAAAASFAAITAGAASLSDKVAAIYNALIPVSEQDADGLAYVTRPEALAFYSAVAAERGVAGADGAAIVALASILNIAYAGDVGGIGDSVNDLLAAIADGSAALPLTGDTFTPIEIADGTHFDGDDVSPNNGVTLTLTNSAITGIPDALAGGAGDDTFNGLTPSTLNTGDALEGGGGDDTLLANLANSGFGGVTPTLSGIENLVFSKTGNGDGRVNLGLSSGYDHIVVEDVNTNGNVRVSAINSTDVDLEVNNVGAIAVTDYEVWFEFQNGAVSGAADSVNLELNNVGTAAGTNAANHPDIYISGSAGSPSGVEVLNINATGNARVGLSVENNSGAGLETLKTLNIEGAGDLRIYHLDFAGSGASATGTIDASKATGDVDVRLADAEVITFTGGTGDDRIDLGTSLTTADKLDGGAGYDTVAIENETSLVSGLQVTNFEAVELLNGIITPNATVNLGRVPGANELILGGDVALGSTVTGLKSGGTVGFQTTTNNTLTAVVTNATAAGTNDTLNVELTDSGMAVWGLRADGVENINVNSVADTPNGATPNWIWLETPQARVVTVTGNQAIEIGMWSNDIDTVDASATTGGFSYLAGWGYADGIAITGGSGNDRLAGSDGKDTIVGGAGNDIISGEAVFFSSSSAPAVAYLQTITPGSVEIGDTFVVTINGTDYSFTATAANAANVTAGLAAVIGNAGGAIDGVVNNAGTLTINGPANGAWVDVATSATNRVAAPEVSTVQIANGLPYDAGDTIRITINGVNFDYVATQGQTADVIAAALATAITTAGQMSAIADANGLITLTGLTNNNYTVVAPALPVDIIADTPTVLSYQFSNGLVFDANEVFSLTLGANVYSITNTGLGQDDTMQAFVTTHAAAILAETGGTLSYDNGTDLLTISRANGTGLNGYTAANSSAAVTQIGGFDGFITEAFNPGVARNDNGNPLAVDNAPTAAGADTQTLVADPATGGIPAISVGYTLVGWLASDILTGGEGNDRFIIFNNGNATTTNIDTITDLNLGGAAVSTQVDTIALEFAINTLYNGGAATALIGAASLDAAVDALFGLGGGFNGIANAAGLFTYGGDTYLIAAGGGDGSFDGNDAIVKVTGVTGALDLSDFVSTAMI